MNTHEHVGTDPRRLPPRCHPGDLPRTRRSLVSRIPPPSGAPHAARLGQPREVDDLRPPNAADRGDLEKLFPRWLDQVQASGGTNYLGYVALLLPVALLAALGLLAIVVAL